MIKAFSLGMLIVLAGCATKPVTNVDYYLLNSADAQSPELNITSPSLTVTIADISLANYLIQTNLAIQLSSHKLHYSKQHYWAEPLQIGIQKALLKDLNSASEHAAFVSARSPMSTKTDMTIAIQIDHFVATHDSMVVMAGYYWLTESNVSDLPPSPHHFHFSRPLEQDGYPHSVSQLRLLINALSGDILSSLQPLEKP